MSGYLTIITPGLPAPIAAALKIRTRVAYDEDGQFDAVVVDSARIVGSPPEGLLREALRQIEISSRPGGRECATRAITMLRAKTMFRASVGADPHAIGKAYVDALAIYPADVIERACREWADGSKWWPTWAELKRECDRLSARRRAEHRAIKAALERPPQPAPSASPLPSREERLATVEAVNRRLGQETKKSPGVADEPGQPLPAPKAPAGGRWAGNADLLELARRERMKFAGDTDER